MIPGATGNSITPTTNGNYEVTVSSYGCEALASFLLSSVGIKDAETNEFSVTPNPTTDSFMVTSKNNSPDKFNLEVFDLVGNAIVSENNISAGKLIDITKAAAGIYTIRLSSTKGSHSMKLIRK